MAREAIERFLRILMRCGFTHDSIRSGFESALGALPVSAAPALPDSQRELLGAAHLLTLWLNEPEYVDTKGRPRRLRRRGPAPSFETLLRRVNPSANVDQVLQFLLHAGAVSRRGAGYFPARRSVVLRALPALSTFRMLRGLVAMLRTQENNLRPIGETPDWFERTSENAHFPLSRLPEFAALLEREGMALLARIDAFMRACEVERNSRGPTVTLGVGIYRYQVDATRPAATRRRRRH